ncbi:helix-turn-helix domain-containing protein [Paenibacillus sp. NPDC057967]|uniref:helix-turn-helix domain-containing protein n=1 Tax=Paenibacillus sp. NPDC057967 TaxID=3346293 RepID=UPI0036DAF0ED
MDASIFTLKSASRLQLQHQASTLQVEFPSFIAAEGGVKVKLGRRTVTLQNGVMMFLRPWQQIKLLSSGTPNVRIHYIAFESYRLMEESDNRMLYHVDWSILPESGWVSPNLSQRAYSQLRQLTEAPIAGKISSRAKRYMLEELLDFVFSGDGGGKEDVHYDKLIDEAIAYVHGHYEEPITRAQLAGMAGFNETYFSTLFRKRTGWGFSEYLNRFRIGKAKERLLASDQTLHEIALSVGYKSGLYLSRKFKAVTGMTPGQFRSLPKPARIAAFQFVGHLLALGVQPIATDAIILHHSLLLKDELRDVHTVSEQYGADDLKSLGVDLILAPTYFYHTPDKMKQLEEIAPVVTLDWAKLDPLEEVRLIGKLVGKEAAAEQWINRYLAKARYARLRLAEHIKPNETVALYEIREQSIGIWNRTLRGAYNLYNSLGMTAPERIQQEVLLPDKPMYITESELPEYAADHMFVVICDSPDYEGELNRMLREDEAWRSLPAAKHNRIYPLKLEECWSCEGLSLEKQLEKQVEWLLSGHVIQH